LINLAVDILDVDKDASLEEVERSDDDHSYGAA